MILNTNDVVLIPGKPGYKIIARHDGYVQVRCCSTCENVAPELEGKSLWKLCDKCRLRRIGLYEERKAAGLCPTCGNSRDRLGKLLCSVCAERRSATWNLYKERYNVTR